ncbi:MAG: inositol monophosphatase family protein [Candidatus Peribacteraceae bacterium]|jgi:myo-inositol-1(or 4)-monophosphatase
MSLDHHHTLDTAIAIAKEAGAFITKRQKSIRPETAGSNLGIATKSTARDFVTDVDRESQQLIVSRLQEHFPQHGILGEEEGADHNGSPGCPYTWVIDPVDGTCPFLHGREDFGVILALQNERDTEIGVIFLPRRNELFYAIRGKGAFFNGKPVVLRNTRNMNDAILCSNLIHRLQDIDGVTMVSAPFCANVENYGCAAREIGEILKGCNDGVFFLGPRLWDLAAGFMMIEEAGGKAFYEFTEPDNMRSALRGYASTTPIFEELKEWMDTKMEKTL